MAELASDRRSSLMAISITEASIATLFYVARAWSRISTREFGLDDLTMLGSLLFFLVLVTLFCIIFGERPSQSLFYYSNAQTEYLFKLGGMSAGFMTLTQTLNKISIAFLLLRIMGKAASRRRVWFLRCQIVLTVLVGIVGVVMGYVHCLDLGGLSASEKHRRACIRARYVFAIFGSSWFCAMDFILATFPVLLVYGLQMPRKRKVAVCCLFGLGLLTATCGVVKTVMAERAIQSSVKDELIVDIQFLVFAWSNAEAFLAIVCGSVPTLGPLYGQIKKSNAVHRLLTALHCLQSRVSSRSASSYPRASIYAIGGEPEKNSRGNAKVDDAFTNSRERDIDYTSDDTIYKSQAG